MGEWVRRWEVTIRWERASDSPKGTTKWVTHAHTPRQLRRLIEGARGDRGVVGYSYRSITVMEGDEPTHCQRGHAYGGGSATQPRMGWTACVDCHGHLLTTCRHHVDGQPCGDVRANPRFGPDCAPVPPPR